MPPPKQSTGSWSASGLPVETEPGAGALPLVVLPRELGQLPPAADLVGEKAHQLAKLLVLKARVPRFGVLTVSSFRAHMERRELVRELAGCRDTPIDEEATRLALSETLIRAVAGAPLPEAVERAVEELVASFTDEDLLAVRPSPVGDSPELRALSGHLETFLFVRGKDAVSEAVRQCFASAFSPGALLSRWQAGLSPLESELGVIVQRMVVSEASGACFSTDPGTPPHEPKDVVIDVTWGLAGGMARSFGKARVGHDRFRVRRPDAPEEGLGADAPVKVQTARKEEALRFADGRGHGTELRAVAPADQDRPAITDNQARAVAEEAIRLEAALGRPVSFAFAFAGRLLHLLEAHPQRAPRAALESQRLRTWDERLVPEGLQGATTPLTQSLLQRVAARAARRGLSLLGLPEARLAEVENACERLYGQVGGRLYANVAAFESLLSRVPEADLVLPAVARVTGVADLCREPAPRRRVGLKEVRRFSSLRRLARRVGKALSPLLEHGSERALRLRLAPLDQLDADRLLDQLDEAEALLVEVAAACAVTGLFSASFTDLARRLLEDGGVADADALLVELLSGHPHDRGLQLAQRLEELARLIAERPVVRRLLDEEERPEALLDRMEGLPQAKPAFSLLKDTLERFGARGIESLKIESLPLKDRPSLLIALVKGALCEPPPAVDSLVSAASGVRKKAEYRLETRLGKQRVAGLSSRRGLTGRAAADAALALEDAESLRLLLEEAVEAARAVLRALGDRLFEHDLLDQPKDLLYLSVAEVRGVVRGTGVDQSPRPVVAARKQSTRAPSGRASRGHPTRRLPERLETAGIVVTAALTELEPPSDAPPCLEGLPVSPGAQTGEAFLLEQPRSLKGAAPKVPPPGSVIVLPRLDPLLVPFLLGARAVVVERLLPLSVAAGRLRSLGIPAVGGVAGAMRVIRAGERLVVDGHNGTVTLADRLPKEAAPELHVTDAEDFARLAAPSNPEVTALPAARGEAGEADEPTDPDGTELDSIEQKKDPALEDA